MSVSPAPSHDRRFEVGGEHIVFRSAHDEVWPGVARVMGEFEVADGGDGHQADDVDVVEIHLVDGPAAPLLPTASVDEDGDRVRIAFGRARAVWDRAARHCVVEQPRSDVAPDVPHPEYGFGTVARIMLSYRLTDRRSLFVHSAGVVRHGDGRLFLGVSGAGKSTVAASAEPSDVVLSDDVTLVTVGDDTVEVSGTPFHGEFGSSTKATAPLRGLYFLRQADADALHRLDERAALHRLLRCVLHFGADRAEVTKVLDLALSTLQRVPAFELDFTRTCTFWHLIDEHDEPTAAPAGRLADGR